MYKGTLSFLHPVPGMESDTQKFLDKCLKTELVKDEIEAPADVDSQAPGDACFFLELSSLLTHGRPSFGQVESVLSSATVQSGWSCSSWRGCITVAQDCRRKEARLYHCRHS